MRLSDVIDIHQPYQFQLVSETDDQLTFTLQGNDGRVLRVTLSADMVALPDAAMLFATVREERNSESAAEFWAHGDEDIPEYDDCDGGSPFMFDWLNHMAHEVDPPADWAITPDGREFELQQTQDQLF